MKGVSLRPNEAIDDAVKRWMASEVAGTGALIRHTIADSSNGNRDGG